MRHYRFYILFVAVLTLSGCADFLDRDPLEQASANTFWKTEAEIKSGRKAIESVIGVRKLHGECGITELLEEISPTKKEQVLFKIANKNSQIF